MLLADGRRALLGSTNMHRHAFEVRRELSAIIDDKPVVARLGEVFASDWDGSAHFHAPDPFEAVPDDQEAFGL